MSVQTPPPVPATTGRVLSRRAKLLIALACLPGILLILLVVLRLCGLICPFNLPTGGMTPALCKGDRFLMENITFLFRQPQRGDIVIFDTKGIELTQVFLPTESTKFVKRVVGEPGDHLRISQGNVFINGKQVTLSNAAGVIVYDTPAAGGARPPITELTVPANHFFVLGDNSTNSLDSRYWGTVPRKNIEGRASFLFWPLQRCGQVE